MMISMALFAQLAASCAPTVHVQTLAAIARTESGLHAGAINDNTTRRQYRPGTREEAIALAAELVHVKGHSVDLGLMQINSRNLPGLNLALADAFEPCASIAAGARVLVDGYRPPAPGRDTQQAVLETVSRYNTGDAERGFGNGYVAKVVASAEQLVPAIRPDSTKPDNLVQTGQASPGLNSKSPEQAATAIPPQPWDVFGQARFVRQQAQRRVLLPPQGLPAQPDPSGSKEVHAK